MLSRRPRRNQVRAVLHAVALGQPADFDAIRMVGGFNSAIDLGGLGTVPAAMVLDAMGVHTAAELLAVLRGASSLGTIAALTYVLGGAVTGDDVIGATVIVPDEHLTFPPSLTP